MILSQLIVVGSLYYFALKSIGQSHHDKDTILSDISSSINTSTYDTKFLLRKYTDKSSSNWGLLKKKEKLKSSSNTFNSLSFQYEYDECNTQAFPSTTSSTTDTTTNTNLESSSITASQITLVLLIHPIGVGIGRWYYNRLITQFTQQNDSPTEEGQKKYIFLAPDLLGCGSASNPILITGEEGGEEEIIKKIPLLSVDDWSEQLVDFMAMYETKLFKHNDALSSDSINWCVVSNGGCVPIALDVAVKYVQRANNESYNDDTKEESNNIFQCSLTNLILSATPSVASLLRPKNQPKVEKSYRRVSGILGNLFWWYSLRKDGKFIQTFSEKNLFARPENTGPQWRPNCVKTAKINNRKSRFSTFAFLAGTLNGGCQEKFDVLKGRDDIQIDVVIGTDKRMNSARSWFWEKRSKTSTITADESKEKSVNEDSKTLDVAPRKVSSLLQDNGNGGRERFVGGRICLAHEDAPGYANAIVDLLQ